MNAVKYFLAADSLLGMLAVPCFGQLYKTVAWDGFVKRGKVSMRAGGSGWSVNGERVSHTEELYDSPEAARYVLSRLRGTLRPGPEVTPKATSVEFKVTMRRNGVRIAWACGNDLHYVEARSYSAAAALLNSWGFERCG
jgi:hypothetical protein